MGGYAMIVQHIYLSKYDWYIIVFYVIDHIDTEEVLNTLKSMDCDEIVLEGIELNLSGDVLNTGFTVSNIEDRISVVLIGPTSDAAEFQNTYDHEKGHVATHIAKTLDIDAYGEGMQYLNGTIGKQMFPVAKYFLCDECRSKLYEE